MREKNEKNPAIPAQPNISEYIALTSCDACNKDFNVVCSSHCVDAKFGRHCQRDSANKKIRAYSTFSILCRGCPKGPQKCSKMSSNILNWLHGNLPGRVLTLRFSDNCPRFGARLGIYILSHFIPDAQSYSNPHSSSEYAFITCEAKRFSAALYANHCGYISHNVLKQIAGFDQFH